MKLAARAAAPCQKYTREAKLENGLRHFVPFSPIFARAKNVRNLASVLDHLVAFVTVKHIGKLISLVLLLELRLISYLPNVCTGIHRICMWVRSVSRC